MNKLFSAILILLVSNTYFSGVCLANTDQQNTAISWLEIIDAGNYQESWNSTAPVFQQHLTSTQWNLALKKVRRPLGKRLSRKLLEEIAHHSLPEAPTGKYIVVKFSTSFENKASVLETVTLKQDDAKWRVAGYFIK